MKIPNQGHAFFGIDRPGFADLKRNSPPAAAKIKFEGLFQPKSLTVLAKGKIGKVTTQFTVQDSTGERTIPFPAVEIRVDNNVTP